MRRVFFIRRACLTFPVNASTRQSYQFASKGKERPPCKGGLGGVEPEKQPLRFADANHLPLQGRQGTPPPALRATAPA